jgi:hypothetical protein
MAAKYAYLDLDAVAYAGACSAEKTFYKWKKKDGSEPDSNPFQRASEAKGWMDMQLGFDFITDVTEWERVTYKEPLTLKVATDKVDDKIKEWQKSIRELFDEDAIFKGYLTCSGPKNKDIKGLEHRYQHNRYLENNDFPRVWTPQAKPSFLSGCREYLLTAYDWVKMSPAGVEADACVILEAERKGYDGCLGFVDKDLRQAMRTCIVEMNAKPIDRKLEKTSELGDLRIKFSKAGVKMVEGEGFKLVCFQTVVGDGADGYKGVKGVGAMAGYNLLKDCLTVLECCEILVAFYSNKFPDGIIYDSWDGVNIHKSAKELLVQHQRLAYHERGSKDLETPIERYIEGAGNVIKRVR